MTGPRIFDAEHYASLNATREEALSGVLKSLTWQPPLRSAIDVGCGTGYFSKYLESQGFEITAVDGREENVADTNKRVPNARVATINAEDPRLSEVGKFDLVLCFGLLYHLENPFRTIRSLHEMTKHLLLVEGVIFAGKEMIMGLVDEGHGDDQGLNYVAFYPTESCLIKMIYRAGFRHVYKFREMPKHPDFRPPRDARRVRTMLAASEVELKPDLLERVAEPETSEAPWINSPRPTGILKNVKRFAAKPMAEKIKIAKRMAGLEGPKSGKKP